MLGGERGTGEGYISIDFSATRVYLFGRDNCSRHICTLQLCRRWPLVISHVSSVMRKWQKCTGKIYSTLPVFFNPTYSTLDRFNHSSNCDLFSILGPDFVPFDTNRITFNESGNAPDKRYTYFADMYALMYTQGGNH